MSRSDDAWSAVSDRIADAASELQLALAAGRAELAALQRQPLFTPEEKERIQEIADRGEMGPGMRELAREVRQGRADWEQIFRRHDEHGGVLEEFVERSQELYGEELARAFAASDAPDDIEDPRRRPPW